MAEQGERSSKWKFYNVIILGVGFFLVFTAFQTTANVQVRVMGTYSESQWNVCETLPLSVRPSHHFQGALRMSFLSLQTTTISVFFSEKCNSVSWISPKPKAKNKVRQGNSGNVKLLRLWANQCRVCFKIGTYRRLAFYYETCSCAKLATRASPPPF